MSAWSFAEETAAAASAILNIVSSAASRSVGTSAWSVTVLPMMLVAAPFPSKITPCLEATVTSPVPPVSRSPMLM